jgi:hypothetical protein
MFDAPVQESLEHTVRKSRTCRPFSRLYLCPCFDSFWYEIDKANIGESRERARFRHFFLASRPRFSTFLDEFEVVSVVALAPVRRPVRNIRFPNRFQSEGISCCRVFRNQFSGSLLGCSRLHSLDFVLLDLARIFTAVDDGLQPPGLALRLFDRPSLGRPDGDANCLAGQGRLKDECFGSSASGP